MSNYFNTDLDIRSDGKAEAHLSRKAEVIFIKRASVLPEPGYTKNLATDVINKFQEFIDAKLMVRNSALESLDPDPDNITGIRYNYWVISASSVGATSKVGGTSQLLPNADVESISVTTSASKPNSAVITLRNYGEKYTIKKNPLFIGETVFESDDLVYINLPGLNNKLYRKFTGLITTVPNQESATGDGFVHRITIECSDMMKRLWEVRTNVRPSIGGKDAQGSKLSVYNNTLSADLPHAFLSKIFVRAYCDKYSVAGVRQKIEDFRAKDPETGAAEEEKFMSTFDQVPSEGSNSSDFLFTQGTITQAGGTALAPESIRSTEQEVPKEIPKRIFGFKRTKPSSLTTVEKIMLDSSPIKDSGHPLDDLAFLIEGTSQPAFNVTFANYSMSNFNSEWKSSYDIAKQVADLLNFELNTTESGVLRFRALNNLLPADAEKQQTTGTTRDPTKTRVGYEYWLHGPYIKDAVYSDTDDGIFTIAQVMGQYQYATLNSTGIPYLNIGRVVDSHRKLRLGDRPAPQQTRIYLLTEDACKAAASAYLIRMNSKAKSATIQYMGDARLSAGNPCYIPHKNRVYYIDSITHNFQAGSSYSMTMNLTYGRSPIAVTTEKANELSKSILKADPHLASLLNSYYTFQIALSRLTDQGSIDSETRLPSLNNISMLERYRKHGPDGDKNLVFNGFVWEELPTGTYEELQDDYLTSNQTLAANQAAQELRIDSQRVIAAQKVLVGTQLSADKAKEAVAKKSASDIKSSIGNILGI